MTTKKLALAKEMIAEKNEEITANKNMISEIKKLVDENSDNKLSEKIYQILFKNTPN